MTPADIDLLIDEIVTLPTLPQNVDHVTRLLSDPDMALVDLGMAIATDPALALKTLRLVNSAYYGLRQEVASVELAVKLLGAKVVRNLVVTAIVCETLRDARLLLRHSVATALAMRALSEQLRKRSPLEPDDAFTHGLLHDTGKIIIESFLPREAETIGKLRRTKKIRLSEAEREVLDTDHAELGARLAMRWRLPQRLSATIAAHHQPQLAPDPIVRQSAGMVAVANAIATATDFKAGADDVLVLDEEEWEASRVTKPDLMPALDGYFKLLPALESILGTAASC